MKETQEMLEFCKEKGVRSTIEVVKMDYVNTAMDRLVKNDVRYRFVVDVAGSKLEDEWMKGDTKLNTKTNTFNLVFGWQTSVTML